jgi:uncharacterized membrane protein
MVSRSFSDKKEKPPIQGVSKMTHSMYLFLLFLGLTVIFLFISVSFAYKAKFAGMHDIKKQFLFQEKHIRWIKLFYLAMGGAVLSILKVVSENNGTWGPLYLQNIHRTAVIILTVLLVSIFFHLNGRKNKFLHKKIVYVFFVVLGIALITGSTLFLKHPHFT